MSDEPRKHSRKIHDEADRLLSHTGLFELLGQFGQVDLGGSYAYNLMVDRDLDFGVAIKEVTPEVRAKIVETFASQEWAYSVNMTDRINFEPLSNLNAPRGLFLGLTIPFPKERWNIDVWFLVTNDLPKDQMTTLIENASSDQLDTILEIKYELMKSDQKQKGVTSSQVYEAVITKGIKSTRDFLDEVKNGRV